MRDGVELLTQKWQAGAVTNGVSLAMASLLGAEAMAGAGWDSVTVDMQHGALDDRDMMQLLQAMAPRATVPFVRVPWNSPPAIMKALDAGAQGLFCPLIETGAAAQAFVESCYYPPHGNRSIGPLLAQLRHSDDYVKIVAPKILSFAMIESAAGIEALDGILAVPQLTGVYVGSSDLALDITGSPLFDPALAQVGRAVEQIARNTRDRGKIAAIHIVNMAHAGLVRELGYQHVVFASDYRLMMKAAAEAYAELSIALA
jgi:4-hydroxy-2-oxoheptanedioate aldolase